MELTSEPIKGVTLELHKSTKGVITWDVKITDMDDNKALDRVIKVATELNDKFKGVEE